MCYHRLAYKILTVWPTVCLKIRLSLRIIYRMYKDGNNRGLISYIFNIGEMGSYQLCRVYILLNHLCSIFVWWLGGFRALINVYLCLYEESPSAKTVIFVREKRIFRHILQSSCDWNKTSLCSLYSMHIYGLLRSFCQMIINC